MIGPGTISSKTNNLNDHILKGRVLPARYVHNQLSEYHNEIIKFKRKPHA